MFRRALEVYLIIIKRNLLTNLSDALLNKFKKEKEKIRHVG